MAKRRHYGSSASTHAREARVYAALVREKARDVRDLIARGKCERALEQLVAFGVNEGAYQEARIESGMEKAISKVHKVRSSLIGRYIGKCVK